MKQEQWIRTCAGSLSGKTAAITGSTGSIGRALCRAVVLCGGDLVLLSRNDALVQQQKTSLLREFPGRSIRCIHLELSDLLSVENACGQLLELPVDLLILNAGAYDIPREICSTGLDNVYQINFASPYYLTRRLLPLLDQRGGRVIAVGSIAHRYAPTDPADPDFSSRSAIHLVYGNSKRYLMYGLWGLFEQHSGADLVIAHPGLTLTNISNHYPPLIFRLIRRPMKILFMKPPTAARSIINAMFTQVPIRHWIGPRLFDIWGAPAVKAVNSASAEERRQISATAEALYRQLRAETAQEKSSIIL